MGVVVQGEVLSFDQVKGYGFILDEDGGPDVFLHANDLLEEKHLIRPGVVVEYVREAGERGPKASSVHLLHPVPGRAPAFSAAVPGAVSKDAAGPGVGAAAGVGAGAAVGSGGAVGSGTAAGSGVAVPAPAVAGAQGAGDVRSEITELLLRVDPPLTGPQILAVRTALSELGARRNWPGA